MKPHDANATPSLPDDMIPSDPLTAIAWRDCLSWAIGDPDIIADFRADTGNHWAPATTPIDRMVDEACGADTAFFRAFIEWFNENIWGDLDIVAGEAP